MGEGFFIQLFQILTILRRISSLRDYHSLLRRRILAIQQWVSLAHYWQSKYLTITPVKLYHGETRRIALRRESLFGVNRSSPKPWFALHRNIIMKMNAFFVQAACLILAAPLAADQGARECISYPVNKNTESSRFPLSGTDWLTKNYFDIHNSTTRLVVAVDVFFPDSDNASNFGHSATLAHQPYKTRVKVTEAGGSTTISDWAYLATPPTRESDSTHFVLNGTFPIGSYYVTIEVDNPSDVEIWTNKVWASTLLANATESMHDTAAFGSRSISHSEWTTLATVGTASRGANVAKNYILVSNARITDGDDVSFRLLQDSAHVLRTDNVVGIAGAYRHINLNMIYTDPQQLTSVPAGTIMLQAKSSSGNASHTDGGFLHLMEVDGDWYKLSSSNCTQSNVTPSWTYGTICQSPSAYFESEVGVAAYGVGNWNVSGAPSDIEVEFCSVLKRSSDGTKQVEIGCKPLTADSSANEVFAHQNDLVRYGLPSGQAYHIDVETRGLCFEPGQTYSVTSGNFEIIFPPMDGAVDTLHEVCNDSWYNPKPPATPCIYTCDWNDSLYQRAVNTNDRCNGGPLTPPPQCEGLAWEAEDGVLTGFTILDDYGASGGQYIAAPNGTGNQFGGPHNDYKASYCVTISEPGNYRINARIKAPTHSDDSFYVRIDGAPTIGHYWDLPVTTLFTEDYVADSNNPVRDPLEVYLTAGSHIIDVFRREDGAGLDKLEMEPAPCGALIQEAEDGALVGFTTVADGAASGGEAIEVPNGTGNQLAGPNENFKASYCFGVAMAGIYRIEGRLKAPSFSDDSFWVRVDGAPVSGFLWDTTVSTSYLDDYVNDLGGADPVEVFLTAGDHIVDLFQREDGARLDRIELTPAVPPPCGPLAQEAEDGTLVGFTTVADGAASGGEAIEVPNGTGNQLAGPNENFKASYCFSVATAGTYRIKGRLKAPSFSDDSFWVRVDGAPVSGFLWDTAVSTSYVDVFLDVGNHTVDVFQREDGPRIDRLTFERQ